MKGTEYPMFQNKSSFAETSTVTGPKSDSTPSMSQWLASSTVEEETEQLQLGLHSIIGNQDSNMQQTALSQKPPETDQPKRD